MARGRQAGGLRLQSSLSRRRQPDQPTEGHEGDTCARRYSPGPQLGPLIDGERQRRDTREWQDDLEWLAEDAAERAVEVEDAPAVSVGVSASSDLNLREACAPEGPAADLGINAVAEVGAEV
jgi:hypothetical protein